MGLLAAIGQQQDTYQGFRQPGVDDNQMNLYVGPADPVATLETVRQVLDDNMDGITAASPRVEIPRPDRGALQRDLDSIIVGEEKPRGCGAACRRWRGLVRAGLNENHTDVTGTAWKSRHGSSST